MAAMKKTLLEMTQRAKELNTEFKVDSLAQGSRLQKAGMYLHCQETFKVKSGGNKCGVARVEVFPHRSDSTHFTTVLCSLLPISTHPYSSLVLPFHTSLPHLIKPCSCLNIFACPKLAVCCLPSMAIDFASHQEHSWTLCP